MKKLVIVESPAKARTLGQYLGGDFVVRASYGHVRDLPSSELAIDVEKNYQPKYQLIPKAKKVLTELRREMGQADGLVLATDLDREGEAIAWHLTEALNSGKGKAKPIERITFHEITKSAVEEALKHPRALNSDLIDAQQARRVLDRLVGYKLSPLLWKKVYRGLSAGRVQSVTVRLIVEREREISAFKTRRFYTIEAEIKVGNEILKAYVIDQKNTPLELLDKAKAESLAKKLTDSAVRVDSREEKESLVQAAPPLITSTLQQRAAGDLRFSAKKTMKIAQDLYEGLEITGQESGGLITYMRTDSHQLADQAVKQAAELISTQFGQKYLPVNPNKHERKVRGAQEAHEAIRPTDFTISPDSLTGKISKDHQNLYRLIWSIALASQMAPAKVKTTTVILSGSAAKLLGRGRELIFDGHLKVAGDPDKYQSLPPIKEGQSLTVKNCHSVEHQTEPPARYSEASLVKEMEQLGIGRPSTYAPTMSTIVERGYVSRKTGRFIPEPVAEVVTDLLKENFSDIVDYQFTAKMEDDLDEIAAGKKEWQTVIDEFYRPFIKNLTTKEAGIDKKELTEEATDKKCPECGAPVVLKLGRYGQFYACTRYPECKHSAPYLEDEFNKQEQKQIASEISDPCPKCGGKLSVKAGRFGEFIGCDNYPKCKFTKPITIAATVKCPNCGGDLVRKTSRRGKVFWGCANYPKCQTAFWDEPIEQKCPKCGSQVVKKKAGPACSQCDWKEEK